MCLQGWLSEIAKQISLQENWGGLDEGWKKAGRGELWGVQGKKTKNWPFFFSPLWLNSKEALFCSQ